MQLGVHAVVDDAVTFLFLHFRLPDSSIPFSQSYYKQKNLLCYKIAVYTVF